MAGAIIGGAIGGLGSFAGGKAQADAMSHAADLQSASTQKALDFAKQRYAQLQTNEAPYQAAGVSASRGLGELLNRAAIQKGYGPRQVQMKAPDGSVQLVDPQHVDFYTQKGATVIG